MRALQLASEESANQVAAAEQGGAQVNQESSSDVLSAEQAATQVAKPAPEIKPEAQAQPKNQAGKVEAKKVDAKKVVKSAKPAEKSIVDHLMDNLLYIGAALAAIAAAVFILLRRRKEEDEEFTAIDDIDDQQEDVLVADVADEDLFAAEADDIELEEQLESAEDTVEEDLLSDADDEQNVAESQTGDAVGEADIYIAYGKLDQAESLLTTALESGNYEDETAVHLKLLEVYSESRELEKFDQHYASVINGGDESACSRAAELRQSFADAPEFEAPQGEDSALDFGESDTTEESEFTDQGEDAEDVNSLVEDEVDFGDLNLDADFDVDDLDLGLDESSLEAAELDSEAELGAVGELELDLDLGDEAAGEPAEDASEIEFDFDLGLDEEEAAGDEISLDELDEQLGEDLSSELEDEPSLTADDEFGGPELEAELSALDIDSQSSAPSLEDAADSISFDETAVDFDFDLDDDFADLDAEIESLSANSGLSEQEFSETAQVEPLADANLESESEQDLAFSLDDDLSGEFAEESSEDLSEEIDSELEMLAADGEELSLGEELDELEALSAELDTELDFEGADSHELAELDDLEPVEELAETVGLEESDSLVEMDSELDPAVDTTEVGEAEFDLAADLGLEEADIPADDVSQAEVVSDLPTPEDVMASEDDFGVDELGEELDFMSDTDESATKLDLARAYIDMGDNEGAKDILDEVVEEGTEEQKKEARELIGRMS